MLNQTPAPSEHQQLIERLVLERADRTATFSDLVGGMPGVPPDEVLDALTRLAKAPTGTPALRALARQRGHHEPARARDHWPELPLPHPNDSEFRFTRDVAGALADELVDATRDGDEILLVGTPSVALLLAQRDVDRAVRFVGPGDCVTRTVEDALGTRLRRGPPPGTEAAAALADPPWYRSPTRSMLRTCASAVRPGGLVVLAGPMPGTRPTAEGDLEDTLRYARTLGLSPSSDVGEVRYATPLFELAALERQGVRALHAWRRGVLLRMRAARRTRIVRAVEPLPGATELTLGGVRLRLIAPDRGGPPELTRIDGHEVFPSVSARAPGRGRANLWTSGNRAFAIDGVAAADALLRIAADEGLLLPDRLTGLEKATPRLADVAERPALIHQLRELAAREAVDARRLLGDGAWLTTARGWRS